MSRRLNEESRWSCIIAATPCVYTATDNVRGGCDIRTVASHCQGCEVVPLAVSSPTFNLHWRAEVVESVENSALYFGIHHSPCSVCKLGTASKEVTYITY